MSAHSQVLAAQSADDVVAEFLRCHGTPIESASDWLDEKYLSFERMTLRQAYFGRDGKEPSLDDANWHPAPSMLDAHRKIRARARAPLELGGQQVFIFMSSNHWAAAERSLIATRREDGFWQVSSVQAVNARMPTREFFENDQYTLSRAESEIVDAILADPCFAVEPSSSSLKYVRSSAGEKWTLETAGFASDRPLLRSETGFGRTAMLYDLLQP